MRFHIVWMLTLVLITGFLTGPVHAQDSDDTCATDLQTVSDLLARAKTAMDAGDVASALIRTQEAQAILERCADSQAARDLATFDFNRLTGNTTTDSVLAFENTAFWQDSDTVLHVTGNVSNEQNAVYNTPEITVTLYNGADEVVATGSTSTPLTINPEASVPYVVRFDTFVATAVRYELTATASVVTPSTTIFYGTGNFTVNANPVFYNESGYPVLSGNLSNTGNNLAQDPVLIASIYDAEERVIAVERLEIRSLSPGEAVDYEITVTDAATQAARFELRISSTTTISCENLPQNAFGSIYTGNGDIALALGCPVDRAEAITTITAFQTFEQGSMAYVQSMGVGGGQGIFVFYNDNTYQFFADTWQEGVDPVSTGEAPPRAGLIEPIRGFGKVWREQPGVQENLGWAIGDEIGDTGGRIRIFNGGAMLYLPQIQQTVVLLSESATWETFRVPYRSQSAQ